MATENPKVIRRRIMSILYESFLEDPMQMLTPADILDSGRVTRRDLPANAHYLHDRGLIELMIGYNPPLFAAARILPAGVDLYENKPEFNKLFPVEGIVEEDEMNPIPHVMNLAREAEAAPLEGVRRDWLLKDVSSLRDELRRPHSEWRRDAIAAYLQWLEGFTQDDGQAIELPSLDALKRLLLGRLK